jgi:flagella basal body P-ring formation protein FlgA
MADLGTTTAPPPPTTTPPDTSSGRRVTRRRSLPGGRAVAGAFLITAAAVGVFAAYLNATAEPTTRYVVATADIPRGTIVTADLLDTVAIDLPETHQSSTVPAGNIDNVIGRVTLGPIRGGDLLQWTTVLSVEPPPGRQR